MDFQARYILIKPPTPETLRQRLQGSSTKDASAIESIIKALPADLDDAKVAELFAITIVNEDLDQAAKALGTFIYGHGDGEDTTMGDDGGRENGEKGDGSKEAEMPDAEAS